jgi:hypothetical protein
LNAVIAGSGEGALQLAFGDRGDDALLVAGGFGFQSGRIFMSTVPSVMALVAGVVRATG